VPASRSRRPGRRLLLRDATPSRGGGSLVLERRRSRRYLATASRSRRLNDLDGREWLVGSKSIMFQQGLGADHPEALFEKRHPAPFAYKDAIRLITFFSREKERVLDPFCGVGSTLKACALAGRHGVGIELNAQFARWARERLKAECPSEALKRFSQNVIVGDARRLVPRMRANSVDFVLTSPPYWSILARPETGSSIKYRKGSSRYSLDKRDLSMIVNYEDFVVELASFFNCLRRVLKAGRYLAIIVSDFRVKERLFAFHADLDSAIQSLGAGGSKRQFVLQGITILAQNSKRLFPYGFPTTYVPNIHHQYVLIYRNLERPCGANARTRDFRKDP
jgi:DNA modification methylase